MMLEFLLSHQVDPQPCHFNLSYHYYICLLECVHDSDLFLQSWYKGPVRCCLLGASDPLNVVKIACQHWMPKLEKVMLLKIMLMHLLNSCRKSLTLKLKNSSSGSSVERLRAGNDNAGTKSEVVASTKIDGI